MSPLIPGVEHLTGGIYDAGGDPSVALDSQGHVFYAGLGFDRTAPPNTVAVNKGTFDGSGNLTWSAPTFINQTTSPSTLNDQEWIAAGPDDVYHALWTDSNNVQNVTWFYGFEFVPTPIHQQDVATAKGKF